MWFVLSLDPGISRWDKGSKWILGTFCLLFLSQYGPRLAPFIAGLPIGCFGMGATALWQTAVEGGNRASGYTNAIQWGNTGMLLACLAGSCLVVYWRQSGWWWRALMLCSVCAALAASLFSESRGGWLAIFAIVPFALILTRQFCADKFRLALSILLIFLVVFVAVLAATPSLRDRAAVAVQQVENYYHEGKGDSSLGVRLQQYELAATMIPEKPWLGWGAHGFVNEMKSRVKAGEYSSWMVRYPQIHNDLLDVWVKVGVLGFLLQLMLYGWVLYIFWPCRGRFDKLERNSALWRDVVAIRIMGSLIPVCYFVFGLTQPFFNHNSGIMTYVFYVAVLWGALRRVESEGTTGVQKSDAGLSTI